MAPGAAAEGSGRVTVHGLEGEDLAEPYLQHIIKVTGTILEQREDTVRISRDELEQIRSDAQKAFAALDGKSS